MGGINSACDIISNLDSIFLVDKTISIIYNISKHG